MKPCANNKKPLTWLALDALDPETAARLRTHLETCPGCRDYAREVSAICSAQAAAAKVLPEIFADQSFHRKLQRRLESAEARPAFLRALDACVLWFSSQTTRAPLVVATAAALVLVMVTLLVWTRPDPAPSGTVAQTPVPHAVTLAVEPTLGAYRLAADESPEALDALLTRQTPRKSKTVEPRVLYLASRIDVEN